jgi:hypothetical protein
LVSVAWAKRHAGQRPSRLGAGKTRPHWGQGLVSITTVFIRFTSSLPSSEAFLEECYKQLMNFGQWKTPA